VIKGQIPKIVSGGQTGADRAALDWALARGIECGGWCPKGRRAEDGRISEKYPLIETRSAKYVQRTEWNVRDTGGTVIFSIGQNLSGGSHKTLELTEKHNKPCLYIHPGVKEAGKKLGDFVADNEIQTLNVAGPRASKEPGVAKFVREILDEAYSPVAPAILRVDGPA
jgi:hypothetical protein